MNIAANPVARRMSGFVDHLRLNGFHLGPRETECALQVAGRVGIDAPARSQAGLKAALCGRHEEWEMFDKLFEAYWYGRGKSRDSVQQSPRKDAHQSVNLGMWAERFLEDGDARVESAGPSDGDASAPEIDSESRLVASSANTLMNTDLRSIIDPVQMAEAEVIAFRLARAIRFNLSRRHKAVTTGTKIDLRRTIRKNLSHGGEPIDLSYRQKPPRPVRLVVLLDVSGSMKDYSRVFLHFVKGLVGTWMEAEAFVFHTRLIKVSDAMRDRDAMRAMTRLSLMADGFGGGTKIGESLAAFNNRHAKSALNSRSVVVIMSDGYDTGKPGLATRELARFRKRARRIIWLNPLAGWASYEPVANAMSAAMPHIDCFAAANTLSSLAALENQLSKL
ncbi:MAG: vWA domain-containing protein [Hyphomicrobiales bacterium]